MISVTVLLDYRSTNKNGSHPLKLSANFVPHVREGIKLPNNNKYISLTNKEFSILYRPKLKERTLLEIRDIIDKRRKQLDTIIQRLERNKILTKENYIKYCGKKKNTSEDSSKQSAENNTPKTKGITNPIFIIYFNL